MRPHCNFCHFLKSAKLVYCFHHFATHSTLWRGPPPSLTWWTVASFMEGWGTCLAVHCQSAAMPYKFWPRPQPVVVFRKGGRRKKLHFCSLDTSYLWYNFLLNLLAILDANELFVPPWEFSKPQDNGFKERKGVWRNNSNAITLSRRKVPACFNWVVQLLQMNICFLFVCW